MNKQEVIQILQDDIKRYGKKDIPENTESQGLQAVLKHRKEKVEAYQIAVSAIEQLNNGWIPVDSRLPEKDGMYLITSNVLGNVEVQYVFFQSNMHLFICNGNPIAWQPLPEPYKEVSE